MISATETPSGPRGTVTSTWRDDAVACVDKAGAPRAATGGGEERELNGSRRSRIHLASAGSGGMHACGESYFVLWV